MRFINSLYKHSWQSVENLKILGVYKNGLCHKGTSLCCQVCLQMQVLEGVMHNNSSSSLSVGLSDSKRCLRTDLHSSLIRKCWSNGVTQCECIWGLWCPWHFPWHMEAAQSSCDVLEGVCSFTCFSCTFWLQWVWQTTPRQNSPRCTKCREFCSPLSLALFPLCGLIAVSEEMGVEEKEVFSSSYLWRYWISS